MTPLLLILTDDAGWHGSELQRAFAERDWDTCFASLRACSLALDGSGTGLKLPGFEQRLPDGVFVRGVPGGTLEEVILRLNILHILRACGIPVYNDGRAIERTVDKAMTSFLLARAAIPSPPTWVVSDPAQAQQLLMREHGRGHDLVCKPVFGSQGQGLTRLVRGDALPEPDPVRGVYYLQRLIDTGAGWFDWRVLVVDGCAVAAMRREADDWVTNVAQGSICRPEPLTGQLASMAERAVQAVGAQYGGVDLICDRDGCLWVLEVNGIPAWKGLQNVCDIDIAGVLANGFLRQLVDRPAWDAVAI